VSEIGNSLREARIRRGLTIKDVEDVTKIRSRYLEALEQDDFEMIPGSTFAKAFLRTYATYLKLDGDKLVEEYRRTYEVHREEPGLMRSEAVQKPRSRTVAERKKRRTRRNQRGYAIAGVFAVVAIFLLIWFGLGARGSESPPLDSASFPSAVSSTNPVGEGVTTTVGAGTGSSTTTSPLVITGENIELLLTVSEGSCWLVVHEDGAEGDELFAGTLSAGGKKTFNGAKRYWMNVGKPEVLKVSVNGQALTFDGQAGAYLVTEAGIVPSQ
jgi:cytoskeletal protein RodZ